MGFVYGIGVRRMPIIILLCHTLEFFPKIVKSGCIHNTIMQGTRRENCSFVNVNE